MAVEVLLHLPGGQPIISTLVGGASGVKVCAQTWTVSESINQSRMEFLRLFMKSWVIVNGRNSF